MALSLGESIAGLQQELKYNSEKTSVLRNYDAAFKKKTTGTAYSSAVAESLSQATKDKIALAASITPKVQKNTSYIKNPNGSASNSTSGSIRSTFDPLYDGDMQLSYDATGENGSAASFTVQNTDKILSSNLIIPKKTQDVSWWYRKFHRFGWIDPYNTDRATREYLFFTKPDLYLFSNENTLSSAGLADGVKDNPFIADLADRNPWVLTQFQHLDSWYSSGIYSNFMNIFTNAAASKLDMPGIDSESQDVTPNIMGTTITYRGHSLKSDNGYDFTLAFYDTAYLEIYSALKAYDEYMRMIKLGNCAPKHEYIVNHIIPEQFSIYKFIVGSDGETLLYYAKLTGCYFKDVPRAEAGEFAEGQLKYSASIHAQFVEDMNPHILNEFNRISTPTGVTASSYMPVHDQDTIVNNEWARYPVIIKATQSDKTYGKRVTRRGVSHDYFLKWIE